MIDKQALDQHITGNWGEDSVASGEILDAQSRSDTMDPHLQELLNTLDSVTLVDRLDQELCLACGQRPAQTDFWACEECDPDSVENHPTGEDETYQQKLDAIWGPYPVDDDNQCADRDAVMAEAAELGHHPDDDWENDPQWDELREDRL